MKITIESTSRIVELQMPGGAVVPARLWEGATENGIPVHAFITRIAPTVENPPAAVTAEFERDLMACSPPSPELQTIPLRLIL